MNLASLINNNLRVLLVGPPGCGKTARIAAVAAQTNRKLYVVRASLAERVDFGGALVPDPEAGITRALPLALLHELKTTTTPSLLFLDDLGQAPIDVQAALMKLFDKGELSEQVLIWGATNRPGDKAGVTALCEPLRSRFDLAFAVPTPTTENKADGPMLIGSWQDEVNAWCNWVLDTYPNAFEVVAWHRSPQVGVEPRKPNQGGYEHPIGPVLYGWKPNADPALRMPDFRSWETVCKLIDAGLSDIDLVSAAIGKGQAAAFFSFKELVSEIPTPEQVWMDPESAPVPEDPGALCLTSVRLSSAVKPEFIDALSAYCRRMPQMFCALTIRDTYRRFNASGQGARLSANRAWQKVFLENQTLFAAA